MSNDDPYAKFGIYRAELEASMRNWDVIRGPQGEDLFVQRPKNRTAFWVIRNDGYFTCEVESVNGSGTVIVTPWTEVVLKDGKPKTDAVLKRYYIGINTDHRFAGTIELVENEEKDGPWVKHEDVQALFADGSLITLQEHERLVKKALDDYKDDQAMEHFWD